MRLGHHPNGLAAGKVPAVLAGIFPHAVLVERQPCALPGRIIALFGQFAPLAQPVENFAVAGMTVEEGFGQAPQLDEGLVVEGQPLVTAEDRHRRLQPVQRIGMGIGMLLQPGFRRRYFGDIHRRPDHPGIAQRNLREIHGAAVARHHRKAPRLLGRILGARGRCQFVFAFVQRQLIGFGACQILGAGAFQEGVVAPAQCQGLVAQPDREGQRIQDRLELAALFLRDTWLLQPDGRHAAHGAAARYKAAARRVMHRQLEACAAIRQPVQGGGKRQRIGALQTGLQQLLAAAIGKRPRAVTAPDQKGDAARAQQRVAFAQGGLGLGAHLAQRAAQLARGALFGQCP